MHNPFRYFNSSPEVIRLTVMMYVRYPLSLRQVEDLLFERGIDICHETVRFWWNRFAPMFAAAIRKRRVRHRSYSSWRWHLDEVFVRINGETHYLWRAVDHEGEVLEVFATKRRDRKAALAFLRRAMKRYGRPLTIVTDRARLLRCCDEGHRHRGASAMWTLAQQPGRELTPAVPTKRGRDGQIQGHQDAAEVCLRSRLDPQPLSPEPSPQPPQHLQAEPLSRSG
jgi:transposase-like protein